MFYASLIFIILSLTVYPFLFLILSLLLIYLVIKFAMRTSVRALRLDAVSRSPINS